MGGDSTSTGPGSSTGSGGGGVLPAIRGECVPDTGTDYQVGDGQPFASLDDVPWNTLGPGDTVRIHPRAEPYHNKILISTRGAEGHPIKVCGIPSASGELPVIDAAGATTSPHQHWSGWVDLQDYGIVLIATGGDSPSTFRPGFIEVDNLELRGAKPGNHYTTNTGETREYTDRGTGLYIVNGDHVTARGNILHDNSYGLFALSKSEGEGGGEAQLSREILIEGNTIFGNGVVGSDHRHNTYTEALGVTYQFNYFGPLRDGAIGLNLKDRSAGTVIRYNWIDGGKRILDLVDAQEHAVDALADPRYHETFVYGNVLITGPGAASQVVHYGGDTIGYEQNFRKGTLYFSYNTVVTNHPIEELWETTLVNLATDDESVSMVGNVFWNQGTSTLNILRYGGHADIGVNWITAGFGNAAEGFTGSLTGLSNLVVGTTPGLDPVTLVPLAGSPLIGGGLPLTGRASDFPVELQFIPPGTVESRGANGAMLDLGAYDSN
ncbi:MAG: right-handed parallel beta-helix repeat-containing protein [Polyangiaceae bacterium]